MEADWACKAKADKKLEAACLAKAKKEEYLRIKAEHEALLREMDEQDSEIRALRGLRETLEKRKSITRTRHQSFTQRLRSRKSQMEMIPSLNNLQQRYHGRLSTFRGSSTYTATRELNM